MSSVGTSAVSVGNGSSLIQNLGPDNLYLGDASVTTSTGFRISVGESIAMSYSNTAIYAISEGTSEIRKLGAGTGIFPGGATT